MKPAIHIVDDDRLARESLKWLAESAHLSVCEFECGQAFLDHFDDGLPGCVVLDVRMPDINGMELYARLKKLGATIPVIIVTGHADVAMAVRAMKAGAYDFIEKPYNDALMLELLQSAIACDRDERLRKTQVDNVRSRIERLTPREYEVMKYVLHSKQNKVIASELGISIKTVELHRANLMTKMDAASPTELVRLAMIAGLDPGSS
ncbi:LuxR family two component transcriptional regulator [Thiogranum longum]|uniref:LuxR family two component transcriptional regulator n=1 Tax=Thiogranum longum TaxID=1537524 RepID=A0A4R1HB91_9GAMM|nr:response regulator [Thiogranum longum]TCK17871.1 LuxR family two component transcriptional regulator [Thiogranum longum]